MLVYINNKGIAIDSATLAIFIIIIYKIINHEILILKSKY